MKDLEFVDNPRVELIYDIIAGILAVLAVLIVMLEFSTTLTQSQMSFVNRADDVVYIIYVLDFFVRCLTSKNKAAFLKHNFIDLIAILPFSLLPDFQAGSVLKLIRVVTYVLRLIGNVREILYTNGFIYALALTSIITALGSVGIYIFEHDTNSSIATYSDGLWWSFVTVSTVGYGDIVPLTVGGKIIASILMITGLAFLGMLTSTISTYFFSKLNRKKTSLKNSEVTMLDISDLSKEKQQNLISYYEYLKSDQN